ncbi:GNAT family N-acetyltransferase [Arthrobacter gandavensis]|uniref:GNAT family N-acetyltransferase n=1 Tax=Arthrobacter gandavensis TaxID=169960 RepID=UPI00188F27F0|nr:GNAT family N-acetyltransferase [Arthrobacter gandavensis]MBF4994362.1 GNAT family N-acetyltransferase [Arthrobacter gandavensis]
MLPRDTPRLRFREMTPEDLDLMAGLLGDQEVMAYYPAPKTRDEAAAWIAWNEANYARHGYGLWIVETHDGEFLGDCGLTWQRINGEKTELEVGYHIRCDRQGRGYATEAAAACRDFARETLLEPRLVAIIHPENAASRRVAEKLGMSPVDEDHGGPIQVRTVMGMNLS